MAHSINLINIQRLSKRMFQPHLLVAAFGVMLASVFAALSICTPLTLLLFDTQKGFYKIILDLLQ